MAQLIQPLDTDDPLGPLPQEFAAIMRPELPSLIKEIGVEVTRAYPEYARLLDGPNGQAIRVGVEQSLSSFVDLVAEPTSSTALRDDMCLSASGGSRRTRAGAWTPSRGRTGWARGWRCGGRRRSARATTSPPTLMLSFADALFAYVDELESLSREGFLEVQSQSGEHSEALRRCSTSSSPGPPPPAAPSRSSASRWRGRCRRR